MPRCLVSLGSNCGDTNAALDVAESRLKELAEIDSLCVSTRHRTEPVGGPSHQESFLNAVVSFSCDLPPEELLTALQEIEDDNDRRRGQRWDARTLDIDLLLFDDQIIERTELRLPHPRMTFRPFVLEPAAEIAADWRHPECEATLGELLATLHEGEDGVRLLGDDGLVRRWVEQSQGDRVTILGASEATAARQPKLTIDATPREATPKGGFRPSRTLGPCGPRLALADCPPEHWQEEVAAALECVWPTVSR